MQRPSPAKRVRGMTDFQKKVAKEIKRIPRGTTRSYGEIAIRAGRPRAPRAVVAVLRVIEDIPWWRVARKGGTFAPQVAREQEQMLRQEGWKPPAPKKKKVARGGGRKPAHSIREID
jgi:methylated-DNA-protein-cysteine methyltransferase-like protein